MKVVRNFKQEGFSLRVDALKLLNRVLAQQSDLEIQNELVQAILTELKNVSKVNVVGNVVTKESLNQALENIYKEQTTTEEEQAIKVEDAFSFPILQFNKSKHTFDRIKPENFKLHADTNSKINLMRERLEKIHKKLLRDPQFQVNEGFLTNPETIKITSVEELIGSKGPQCVLGYLSKIDDESLFLEDLTGYVKLRIQENQKTVS